MENEAAEIRRVIKVYQRDWVLEIMAYGEGKLSIDVSHVEDSQLGGHVEEIDAAQFLEAVKIVVG